MRRSRGSRPRSFLSVGAAFRPSPGLASRCRAPRPTSTTNPRTPPRSMSVSAVSLTLAVPRKAGPWGYDQQTRYEAVGRIETPSGGLGIVKEFEYLRSHTTQHVKATCAGPLTFGSRIHPGTIYKGVVDVAERFAEVINAELRGLVAAGADFIQLDEPARGNVSGEEMARLFNLATAGVNAKLAFHICFGNRFGRSRFSRSYEPYFPGLLKARAEQFVLEFAGRELSEVDLWKRYGEGRELGAGVLDVKGFNQDTRDQVASRIPRVLQGCPAHQPTATPH